MARHGRMRGPSRAAITGCLLLTGCVSVTVGAAPSPTDRRTPSPTASVTTPSPSPSSSPSPDPTTCSTRLTAYRVDVRGADGVSGSDERVVASALRLAQGHFDVRVPECEPGEVTASVLDRVNERFAAGTFVTDAPHFRIEVYAGGASWARTSRSQVPIIMLHEWYHVLQYSFLECGPPRCHAQVRPIPAWLIEGSAEYAAAHAAQGERLIFYSFIRRYELFRAEQVDTPLQRIHEARTSADYGLSFAAVELLIGDSGTKTLLEFWERAGSTGRWEGAFPDTFGTTPARFYRSFERYRAQGFQR
jgi:hypothetical protein